MKRLEVFWVGGAVALLCTSTLAQTSTFESRPYTDGGGASIVNAYGGEFVYRSSAASDGRRLGHFLLGERVRDEYTLFSAEEEEALWRLRELSSQRVTLVSSLQARTSRRAPRRLQHTAAIDWPKVIVQGTKTCVPRLAFAELSDWRDHLVCWSSETRDVE